jgi:hypothetical protein
MRFYDVPVNRSVPTEANRDLTSYNWRQCKRRMAGIQNTELALWWCGGDFGKVSRDLWPSTVLLLAKISVNTGNALRRTLVRHRSYRMALCYSSPVYSLAWEIWRGGCRYL